MPQTDDCIINMQDLKKESSCEGSASGIKSLMFALKDDIKTWPKKIPFNNRQNFAEHVNTTTDNMEMLPGKRFFLFEGKKDSGELKYVEEGETESKSFRATVEIYRSVMSASLLGFISSTMNAELVLLVKTRRNEWHLIGDEDEGVQHDSAEITSGKIATDPNGGNIIFYQSGINSPTVYKGEIDHLLVVAESGSGSAG